MPDTQFKILCPKDTDYLWLRNLIMKFHIQKVKIRTVNHPNLTSEIYNLTRLQSRTLVNAFADAGYVVSASEMGEQKTNA